MKVDESNFNIFCNLEKKGIEARIIWKDAENIEGYIPEEDLLKIMEDIIFEYGLLEEEHEDLLKKINKRLDKIEEREFQIQMIDHWDNEDRLTDTLLNDEIKALKSFIEE